MRDTLAGEPTKWRTQEGNGMEQPIRIEDDVYFVVHPTEPGWFCGVTVVLGETEIGLIDSGFAETPERYLFPALAAMGRSPGQITMVVNTHGDGDHVMGNRVLKERTPAVIAIHEADAPSVETYDRTLADGDVVRIGDRNFRVLHLPGHTPGNCCFHDEEAGLLVSGDTLVGDRRELIRLGKQIYLHSLGRLAALDIRTLVMGHPFSPAGKNVLRGSEIARMIEACVQEAERS
jgi:glyoxylase-like metal-dependent hydrolase (beta-lactamase superfamily II)